jgi:ATP-dependent Clp protease protease subunit
MWHPFTGRLTNLAEAVIKAAADEKPLTVESVDNHVYFYSEVNTDRALALMRSLREIDRMIRNEKLTRNLAEDTDIPIWLHINSPGGDLFTAFAIADQIMQLKTPVYSIAEGLVASAATIVSVVCPKRYVQPNTYMLIHQFRSWFWGKHEEFKDEMRLQDMLIARMTAFYARFTHMTEEDLTERLKHDFWLDAGQAIELGLADAELAL